MSSEMRKQQFKKGIDSEKGRRGRQDVTINIRKQKKEEGLAKRRQTSDNIKTCVFFFLDGFSLPAGQSTAPPKNGPGVSQAHVPTHIGAGDDHAAAA